MVLFPNAKINVGLRVLRRRPDGYHDIATAMLPIAWCDILEITLAQDGFGTFRQTGAALDCPPEKNLVLKALRRLEEHLGKTLLPLDIVLEKHLPFGAGLGGGSADAAFALRGVNELLGLGLDDAALAAVAARVGADCPFFVYNRPMLATGIGEILEPLDASALDGLWLVVAKPATEAVSTALAYSMITPADMDRPGILAEALRTPVQNWHACADLRNDFEPGIFGLRPEIAAFKERMLGAGALYAAMSGSGAAVFGIFESAKLADTAAALFAGSDVYCQKLSYPRT